jgi:alpha-glucosidase (family GH31 glycosyl hydrolase)
VTCRRRQIALRLALALAGLLVLPAVEAAAVPSCQPPTTHLHDDGMTVNGCMGTPIAIHLDSNSIVHVHAGTSAAAPALVLDPHPERNHSTVQMREDTNTVTVASSRLTATWNKRNGTLSVDGASGRHLLTLNSSELEQGEVSLMHAAGDALYGIHGYNATEPATAGLLRQGTQVAKAGEQGNAGAPFVWSTAGYGVLLASDDKVAFNLRPTRIDIDTVSKDTSMKPPVDLYIFVGQPRELFDDLAQLSGHAPLFPKWAMGFTNSQWGIDEKELLGIVDTYRAKHIPIDNITLDFDWKAWGQDNDGEFRWNTEKFPNGPSGKLKKELDSRGMHLSGIMKPRIHIDTVEGRYATAHNFWFPGKPTSVDYFSLKPVGDIDFDLPTARTWFFNDALKHSFDTGIVGWWNDEADNTDDNNQFMNMQRALYEGQRAYSALRVWSVNRNFWLGSQRYAYGLWSGDIPTGFASMAAQRQRMLSAIDVGAMQWGMDGGGFMGHPGDENYARWIEFGAFTPIFRVHGTFNEKRQPWRYGRIAEAAATKAICLRYALIPYIYASEHESHTHGVGLVQPLIFDYPNDLKLRNDVDAWMFGDHLLVSPVVEQGQTVKHIYLPAGRWIDWFKGTTYQGGRSIDYPIDSAQWDDIPLFIRDGAIIPTQPVMDYVGQNPVTTLTVDVFPGSTPSHFDYYDDDGVSYAYEHGDYFSQTLSTRRTEGAVEFTIAAPMGSYRPALQYYLVQWHTDAAGQVSHQGTAMVSYDNLAALQNSAGEGWTRGHDRFGAVVYVKLRAGTAQSIKLGREHAGNDSRGSE